MIMESDNICGVKLTSGRTVPAELFDEVISTFITEYASYSCEESISSVAMGILISLQEDPGWLPDDNNLSYEDAAEVWSIVEASAREYAKKLAEAWGELEANYIGTRSWEIHKKEDNYGGSNALEQG